MPKLRLVPLVLILTVTDHNFLKHFFSTLRKIYDFLSKVLATFGACAAWDLQTELLQFPFSWHFGPDHSFFLFYDRFHHFLIFIFKKYLFMYLAA